MFWRKFREKINISLYIVFAWKEILILDNCQSLHLLFQVQYLPVFCSFLTKRTASKKIKIWNHFFLLFSILTESLKLFWTITVILNGLTRTLNTYSYITLILQIWCPVPKTQSHSRAELFFMKVIIYTIHGWPLMMINRWVLFFKSRLVNSDQTVANSALHH